MRALIPREVRVLMWKEWRQLRRSRGALASATVLPLLFLTFVPVMQILSLPGTDPRDVRYLLPLGAPPGIAEMGRSGVHLLRGALPLFVGVGGLVAPAVTALYTMIAEREARTLELLAAQPVRVGHILMAKLLVIVLLTGSVALALLGVDAALLLGRGLASVGYVASLALLLACALGYSAAVALLISLLARDLRSANNLNGALFGPTVLALVTLLITVPGESTRALAAAGLFAALTVVCVVVALRVVTFERLLR